MTTLTPDHDREFAEASTVVAGMLAALAIVGPVSKGGTKDDALLKAVDITRDYQVALLASVQRMIERDYVAITEALAKAEAQDVPTGSEPNKFSVS